MEDKELDGLFKIEKEQKAISPPAFVWDHIESDLVKSNKRRPFYLWWFMGLAMMSLISYLLFLSIDHSQIEEKTELANITKAESLIEKTRIQNEENTIENVEIIQGKNDQKNSKLINDISKDKENSDKQLKIAEDVPNNENVKYSTPVQKNDENAQLMHSSSSVKKSFSNKRNSAVDLNSQENSNSQSTTPHSLQLPHLNMIPLSLLTHSRDIYDLLVFVESKEEHQFDHPNELGIFYHFGRPLFSDVESTTEKDWYTASWGVNYTRQIASKLFVGGGFRVTHTMRKFFYESDDLLLISTTPSLRFGREVSRGLQRFKTIDLTPHIEYAFWNDSYQFKVGLTSLINLRLHTEGKDLDAKNEVFTYAREDQIYQQRLGLGISPYLNLKMPMEKNSFINISARYSTYFSHLNNSELNNKIKYSSLGLDIGLSIQF